MKLTPGKDDNEGDGVDDEKQIDDTPPKQQITILEKELTPIEVKESAPEGDRGEVAILIIED